MSKPLWVYAVGIFVVLTPLTSRAAQPGWPEPVEDRQTFSSLLVDQLEYRNKRGADTLEWDAQAWIGGDYNRLWLRTEGADRQSGDNGGEWEAQALYSRLVAPFWDLQAGLRYDRLYGAQDRDRGFAVIGFEGLAPYWFEVTPALFISQDGDLSARLKASYELLFTQRLILQPSIEINAAAQKVEEFGVGSGINDIEFGLRLRYEIKREFAPYIGVSWTNKFGSAADIARSEGERTNDFAVVAGLRVMF
ncbi:MAG TPA: copper resistance protein B [Gammaproteobacteria bacterium]|nr:copper resistance protein B [Gammaproteobacteria bacterium]